MQPSSSVGSRSLVFLGLALTLPAGCRTTADQLIGSTTGAVHAVQKPSTGFDSQSVKDEAEAKNTRELKRAAQVLDILDRATAWEWPPKLFDYPPSLVKLVEGTV